MFYNDRLKWDLAYDVIVVGFGGAGASSARFAADHGAQVLLIDSAPEGSEGGITINKLIIPLSMIQRFWTNLSRESWI